MKWLTLPAETNAAELKYGHVDVSLGCADLALPISDHSFNFSYIDHVVGIIAKQKMFALVQMWFIMYSYLLLSARHLFLCACLFGDWELYLMLLCLPSYNSHVRFVPHLIIVQFTWKKLTQHQEKLPDHTHSYATTGCCRLSPPLLLSLLTSGPGGT